MVCDPIGAECIDERLICGVSIHHPPLRSNYLVSSSGVLIWWLVHSDGVLKIIFVAHSSSCGGM